ncbi:mechanosensitive ion channel family protein [Ottowia sp.]|uniref:mechanosensitive ion channel family protein n=1 Tax=Ottowia sp. TaxID=1898956 RepID=UPI003A87E55D
MAAVSAATAVSASAPAVAGGANAPVLYIDNWSQWWQVVTQQGVLADVLVLLACGVLAWLVVMALRRARASVQAAGVAAPGGNAALHEGAQSADTRRMDTHQSDVHRIDAQRVDILLGSKGLKGVLFPLLWLALTYMARVVLLQWQPTPVLRVALPMLIALAVIRTGVTVLRAAFPSHAVVRVLERTISWMVWVAMALWVTGVLPMALDFLDGIAWKVGSTQLSVRTLIEGALTAGALMLLALWASSSIEDRLLRSATGTTLSVRKVIANVVRASMVFVGLMLGLSAVGIDLTALSVLGGAIGVGIGLGLQKLAANYISGFMVLAERSVRIGDMVRVDGVEGRVSDIRARYTVIRSLAGVEAIVPNETLMTNVVENLSLSDAQVYQSTTVSVGYDSDIELVDRLLTEAALGQPRVLRDPAPAVLLTSFGADGLDFTVGYWLGDPQNGLGRPRSDLNRAILSKLRAHGVEIPFPQRVLHVTHAPLPESVADPEPAPARTEVSPKSQ